MLPTGLLSPASFDALRAFLKCKSDLATPLPKTFSDCLCLQRKQLILRCLRPWPLLSPLVTIPCSSNGTLPISSSGSPLCLPPWKSYLHLVECKSLLEAFQTPTISPKQSYVLPYVFFQGPRSVDSGVPTWGNHEPKVCWLQFRICSFTCFFNKHFLGTGHLPIAILGIE